MCLSPWPASQDDTGKAHYDPEGALLLPCGKCNECIKLRSTEWAIRARHEMSLHNHNCFLTLTYDEDNLDSEFTDIRPFQNFMKSLRKKIKKKIRYMVSHEYGEKKHRPHHHVIIFGYNPTNQQPIRKTKKGYTLYTSDDISKLWEHGYHSIGEANEKTAYYIASYALKGKSHSFYNSEGEFITVTDSFNCSTRPAIGFNYFVKNYEQILFSGELVPRYYEKKIKEYSEYKYISDRYTFPLDKPKKKCSKCGKRHVRYPKNTKHLLNSKKTLDERLKILKDSKKLKLILQEYEDYKLLNSKTRSAYEKYSKSTIDLQKMNMYGDALRENKTDYNNQLNNRLKADII
jgi:hypothetical protein